MILYVPVKLLFCVVMVLVVTCKSILFLVDLVFSMSVMLLMFFVLFCLRIE